MKQLFSFAVLMMIILFTGCRKEEPAELPENGVIGVAHCNNGIMDGDEDGVDCGSSCEPCVLSLADCGGISPGDNTFETTGGANLSFSAGNVVADTSSGVLIIKGTDGTRYVEATFNSATPNVFAEYSVVNVTPGPNEVRLRYYSSGNYDGYSDKLHLNRINGKLSIEFCDVYMSIPAGGYTLGTGKLTEN